MKYFIKKITRKISDICCHSREGGNPDSITTRLDPRSPRAGATPVDGIREDDRGKNSSKNLPPTTYHLQPSRGFTLIETLVAISILMIAVASPLTIAQKGLSSSIYAKDQITASYLAQDAIEYLRNVVDLNVAADTSAKPSNWLTGNGDSSTINITPCSTLCNVDTTKIYPDPSGITSCADATTDGICDNTPLYHDNDRYTQTGSIKSPFTRSVKVEEKNTGIEALITVKVSWKDKGTLRNFSVSTRIFNWR